MKRLRFILAVGAIGGSVVVGGCVADTKPGTDEAPAEAEQIELGGLSLALTSSDSQGRAYRLRNASFTIEADYYWGYDAGVGPSTTVVSTETDPDADRISVRLTPGPYRVTLGGDWYIERLSSAGAERVEQVVLLGEPMQYAYVGQDWYYDLEFRFGVDGTLLDFRHGDLNIDIAIELPGDRPSYDGGTPFPVDAGSPRDAALYPPPVRRDGGGVIID